VDTFVEPTDHAAFRSLTRSSPTAYLKLAQGAWHYVSFDPPFSLLFFSFFVVCSMTRNFPIYTGKTIHDGRIVLLEVIGRGGMSVVYKAIDVVDPARPVYAVKWLGLPITRRPLTAAAQRQYLALLDSECALHGSVSSHPNVVTLHRVIQDEARDCRWMVLDYHPGGDLFRAVTSRNPLWMNEARTKRVFIQLVDALAFCHSRRVYHQDIKPENILLSEDGESVYLSDFGLSTNESFCSEKTGTDYYNPPGMSYRLTY
jgi:serine/threonine protein kinase